MKNLSNIVSTMAIQETTDQINTDMLQELYLNKDNLTKYLNSIEGLLFQRMSEQGETFDKVMLTRKITKRSWTDKKQVEKKFKFLGDKIYEPKKLLTPAQIEKIAGKKNIEGLYSKPEVMKVGARKSEFDK